MNTIYDFDNIEEFILSKPSLERNYYRNKTNDLLKPFDEFLLEFNLKPSGSEFRIGRNESDFECHDVFDIERFQAEEYCSGCRGCQFNSAWCVSWFLQHLFQTNEKLIPIFYDVKHINFDIHRKNAESDTFSNMCESKKDKRGCICDYSKSFRFSDKFIDNRINYLIHQKN